MRDAEIKVLIIPLPLCGRDALQVARSEWFWKWRISGLELRHRRLDGLHQNLAAADGRHLTASAAVAGSPRRTTGAHVSEATAIWLQPMEPLTAGDTAELQGYFRAAADGYFAANPTSFWGAKIG